MLLAFLFPVILLAGHDKRVSGDIILIGTDTTVYDTAGFLTGFAADHFRVWTSPLHMSKKSLKFWIPAAAVTLTTIAYDEKIFSSVREYKTSHSWVRTLSPVFDHGGEDLTVLGTSAAFYIGGLAFGDQKAQQTGVLSLQSLMHAAIIGQGIKLLSGRQRPRYDANDSGWHGFPASLKVFDGGPKDKYTSFVSGHTISVWSVATVIATQYRNKPIVPVICYTIAAGSGLARVTEGAHWLSDVMAGAALGYSIGRFVAHKRKNTKWRIFPSRQQNALMLTGIVHIY